MTDASYVAALRADLRRATAQGDTTQARRIKAELDRTVRAKQTTVRSPEETR